MSTAREIARAIAAGERSAREAVDLAISRIDATHAALNAVVVRRDAEARAEADAIDRRRAAGERLGPLAGVPITVKECLDLAGTPSTFGLPSRAGHRAEADERHVARLRAAGAIVVGKTNVSQLLLYMEADNPLYGMTRNPWDAARAPGGSSGGQGAIVAAGAVPLGLGTDIGGSCRSPAHCCGVVGFKPTAGRLPDLGRFSEPIGQQAIASQVGPIAGDVDDAALALAIANGAGGDDDEDGRPRPLGDHAAVDLRGLTIGWWDDDGVVPAGAAARRAVAQAADALGRAGARVVRFEPYDLPRAMALFYAIMDGDGFAGAKRTLGKDARDPRIRMMELGAGARRSMPILLGLLRLSGRGKVADILAPRGDYSADHYFQLVERQLDYRAAWRAAAARAGVDALLTPAAPVPAWRHGATREIGVAGTYFCLWNVLGWPAGVVPATRVRADEAAASPARGKDKMDRALAEAEDGSAGLPMGVQVAARPWQDHVALAVMRAVEKDARARGEHPGRPALA